MTVVGVIGGGCERCDDVEWQKGPVLIGIAGGLLVLLLGEVWAYRNLVDPTLSTDLGFLTTMFGTGVAVIKTAAVGVAAG
jgi:hypothetical protein